MKHSIDSARCREDLKRDVYGSMEELTKSLEEAQKALQRESREHREVQTTAKKLRRHFRRIKKFLDEHEANIRKCSKLSRVLQKTNSSYYVKFVGDRVPALTSELEALQAKLYHVRSLKDLPLAWLDRSNPSEKSGIQYACSGKRFGRVETGRCVFLPDSRLDALVEVVKNCEILERAPVLPNGQAASPNAKPTILVAHGQPSVGKTILAYRVLEALEPQIDGFDSGSNSVPGSDTKSDKFLFPGGCIYLQVQDNWTEAQFAKTVIEYLEQCMPRQCEYFPPSRAKSPQLSEVVAFFGDFVRERRLIFVLDDFWPRHFSPGRPAQGEPRLEWKQNRLDAVLEMASSNSLVLVCSSYRVTDRDFEAAAASCTVFTVPLAERSLMEDIFLKAWNQEARDSANSLVIDKIEELRRTRADAATKVLDACRGLPAAAAAAGGALFRRFEIAHENGDAVLRDLKGGVSQSMIPGRGLPQAIKVKLDRTMKRCKDAMNEDYGCDAMIVYKSVGRVQLSWINSCIEQWPGESASSAVQVALSDIVSMYTRLGGEGGVDRVLVGVSELNRYLPICKPEDADLVIIGPLFYDHARSLSPP